MWRKRYCAIFSLCSVGIRNSFIPISFKANNYSHICHHLPWYSTLHQDNESMGVLGRPADVTLSYFRSTIKTSRSISPFHPPPAIPLWSHFRSTINTWYVYTITSSWYSLQLTSPIPFWIHFHSTIKTWYLYTVTTHLFDSLLDPLSQHYKDTGCGHTVTIVITPYHSHFLRVSLLQHYNDAMSTLSQDQDHHYTPPPAFPFGLIFAAL